MEVIALLKLTYELKIIYFLNYRSFTILLFLNSNANKIISRAWDAKNLKTNWFDFNLGMVLILEASQPNTLHGNKDIHYF